MVSSRELRLRLLFKDFVEELEKQGFLVTEDNFIPTNEGEVFLEVTVKV